MAECTSVKIVSVVIAVFAVAAVTAGCTTDGTARPVVDLSGRTVPVAEFPFGPATAVPAAQVPGIVSDITLRPLRGDVDPADCTPAGVDVATAVVADGPGPDARGNVTELVATTAETLAELSSAATRCAAFRGGSTGQETVATQVLAPLETRDGVDRLRLRRTLASDGADQVTVLDQWIAQRDGVRVVVQLRHGGAVSQDATDRVAAFFDTAVAAAFQR